ncbi:MAG: hypothetical protein IT305_32360 [Chloroflexi bacterium]|nr:hypothetical protein [Chloroflexota bacterium]
MVQLSATPVSTRYAFVCPDCGRIPAAGSEPTDCECGYSYPKTYVVPYDSPWSFDEPFWTELRSHRALRLLGRFVGGDPARMRELKHVEYLALSRYPGFGFRLLEEFKELRVLELDFLQATTLDGIEALPLTALGLTELKYLQDINALRGLGLLVLRMALCDKVEDYDPIGDLRCLQRFDLEAKVVPSLEFLQRVGTLRRVGLAAGKATGDVVAQLSGLRHLERLGVSKRLIGRAGVRRLQEALPHCAIDAW